ncbi:MAG TPA: bifunctional 5,10-methylenetetrahydrofolate dehydrogenase/5,10-methenyltetrahydrofolate cyclohydrolase [Clostridia bacterium]|nr:bifunctional 5,10-methylenetetrahydrofolate dehydrogenase/5,10-methenyltetrahydrofolate cyclohydrolase [Clostridia bacterium]
MAKLLSGKEVAAALDAQLAARVEALKEKGVTPCLAIVRVGERGDDVAYENSAVKRCEKVGVRVEKFILPETATQEELLRVIDEVNQSQSISGCLLFRPLPKHMNDDVVRNALLPQKDVDGITNGSLAGVFAGVDKGFPPCTAQACMEILDFFGLDVSGKRAAVIGRSLVVGKPAAMMLVQKNATVTVCHTKTKDMPSVCREADILIVSAGRAGVIGKEYVRPGQIVIDVGINVDENGKLCGDVLFEEAEPVVEAITPVPGGVGAVTTSVLIKHVVDAASRAVSV